MDYQELKEGIDQAPLASRAALERLLLYVSAGPGVSPDYAP